jgi:hypothetical protein
MKLPFLLAAFISIAAAHSSAESPPERWQSPSGDFSVVFSGKHGVEKIEADPVKGTAHLDIALLKRPDGIEEAEASVNQRTRPITKAEAIQTGEGWAKFLNVTNTKMSFDEFTPDDKKLTVTGTKMFDGNPMNMKAVFHWGKKTFFLVWVAEPPNVFLSPAGSRFLASVHQIWQ